MDSDAASYTYLLMNEVDVVQMAKARREGDPWINLPKSARIQMAIEYIRWIGQTKKTSGSKSSHWNKSKTTCITVSETVQYPKRAEQLSWLQKWCEQNGKAELLAKPSVSRIEIEWFLHHCALYYCALWHGTIEKDYDNKVYSAVEGLKKEAYKE